MDRITVYVADDHPVFREAVGKALAARPEFELVGSAPDGREALSEIRARLPSVTVVDQKLPSLAGTEILRAIQRDSVPTRTIILSADCSGALVYEAVQLGAAGFLTKSATLAAIIDAVKAVARGETVLAPEVQSGFVGELRMRSQPDRPVLTQREAEVLAMIADGLTVAAIARRLFISTSTVKTHIKSVFEKLGVNERAAAVAEAMRRGLLE